MGGGVGRGVGSGAGGVESGAGGAEGGVGSGAGGGAGSAGVQQTTSLSTKESDDAND